MNVLLIFIAFLQYIPASFDLLFEVFVSVSNLLAEIAVPRRDIGGANEQGFVITGPELFSESVFVCSNHGLNHFGQDLKSLRSPEISPTPFEITMLKQEAIPQLLVEHDFLWRSGQIDNAFGQLFEALRGIAIFIEQCSKARIGSIDIVVFRFMDVRLGVQSGKH